MTVRKIIELIDFIKSLIGKDGYLTVLNDYIVTIDSNPSNLVLLKEITDKAITDYEIILENEIPTLLNKVLVNNVKPFTEDSFYKQLIELKEANYPDPGTFYNVLNPILSKLRTRIEENIIELDKIKSTTAPFLSKDYSEIQTEENSIFAIIFNNEISYNNLKLLSSELKNWDRGLHIYQQIVSEETPKAFEIIEIDQGSIEVVINLNFDVAEKLLDLFKTGLEVYGAYLAYKTILHDKLSKSFKGNAALLKMEDDRDKLMLDNIRIAVRDEVKKQSKKAKNKESLDKKIEEVTKLVTEHIIKGNSVKLLSAPEEKEEVFEKEKEKQQFFVENKNNYKKLDAATKQVLIEKYITVPVEENYENDKE